MHKFGKNQILLHNSEHLMNGETRLCPRLLDQLIRREVDEPQIRHLSSLIIISCSCCDPHLWESKEPLGVKPDC